MEAVDKRLSNKEEYSQISRIAFATGPFDFVLELQFPIEKGIQGMDDFFQQLYDDPKLAGALRRTTTYRLVFAKEIEHPDVNSVVIYTFLELYGRRSFDMADELKEQIEKESEGVTRVLYSGPCEGNFDLLIITSTPAPSLKIMERLLMITIGQAEDVHRGISYLTFPRDKERNAKGQTLS